MLVASPKQARAARPGAPQAPQAARSAAAGGGQQVREIKRHFWFRLQHPNETHGVAQPCPRGFAPVLTGAIWAAAAELLPAVRQLADRYNAQGTRRRFTGKERRRRCRRFTAVRSRLSSWLHRPWTRETSPPLSSRALFAPEGTVHCEVH